MGRTLTKRACGYWISGLSKHWVIEVLGFKYNEKEYEKDGIIGTPDIVQDGEIWEIKTTRSEKIFKGVIPQEWLEQQMAYCYLLDTDHTNLLIFWEIKAVFRVYRLDFDIAEIIGNWQLLRHRKYVLEHALETENYEILPRKAKECGACEFHSICWYNQEQTNLGEWF